MASEPAPTIVYIVDDEASVRGGLARLLRSAGLDARPYDSVESFFAAVCDHPRACIVLDISKPPMSWCDVVVKLNERNISLPVIALSARDDGAWARSLGAGLFLRKPVDDQALLDAIDWVICTSKR